MWRHFTKQTSQISLNEKDRFYIVSLTHWWYPQGYQIEQSDLQVLEYIINHLDETDQPERRSDDQTDHDDKAKPR